MLDEKAARPVAVEEWSVDVSKQGPPRRRFGWRGLVIGSCMWRMRGSPLWGLYMIRKRPHGYVPSARPVVDFDFLPGYIHKKLALNRQEGCMVGYIFQTIHTVVPLATRTCQCFRIGVGWLATWRRR